MLAGRSCNKFNFIDLGDTMRVFISHSFEDKPEFDNIAEALEQKEIELWKPGSLKAGASLADQLRSAISEADVCVFVATRHSVASSWCMAELGAFWGVGKPVVIYLAEASLSEEELPKQFTGHLLERRISRVVESVQTYLEEQGGSKRDVAQEQPLSEMSRNDLKNLITEAVEQSRDVVFVETTLSRMIDAMSTEEVATGEDIYDRSELGELLTSLLGVHDTTIRQGAIRTKWKHGFSFTTDTGVWIGRALSYTTPDSRAPVWFYKDCVVWRPGEGQRIEAIALVARITDHDSFDIVEVSEPMLIVGRGSLGNILRKRD